MFENKFSVFYRFSYIKSLVYAVIPDTFNFNWRFETNPDIAKIYKVHNRDLFNEGMVSTITCYT